MGLHDSCPSCDINLSLTSSKFLNCLHAYCSHCLRKMENRLRCLSGQNNRSGSLNRRSISSSANGQLGNILCPKCHTLTPLSIRYGIDKLISSNFVYQPMHKFHGSEATLKTISQHVNKIKYKLCLAQRFKTEIGQQKTHFLSRINEARDYLDKFVIKMNGNFDLKRLSLMKQIQKIRLRVTNFLLCKIALLEQLKMDLEYLLELAKLLKNRIDIKKSLDHRRSAVPILYQNTVDHDTDLDIKKNLPENRFSLAPALSNCRKEDEINSEEVLSGSILPSLTKRFDHLFNTLDNASTSMEEDLITSESLVENPKIVYLPENYTLFEKVVCEIPILIVDGNNVPIVGSQHLQDMTAKFIFGNNQSLPVELEESGGLFILRFVPSTSCWGQFVMKYDRSGINLMITPTRIEIKPLLLDIKHHKNLKTVLV